MYICKLYNNYIEQHHELIITIGKFELHLNYSLKATILSRL